MIGVMNLTLEEDVSMFLSDTATNSRVVSGTLQTYPDGTPFLILMCSTIRRVLIDYIFSIAILL